MHTPDVTVVVVPRERYSMSLASLDSIYEHTGGPFKLVYVSAGTPPAILEGLRQRAVEHGFELVHTDRLLAPNEARNRGAARVDTKYFVLIDNDVLPEPGWLEPLLECAAATGAAVVGPAVLIGPGNTFHMGPGRLHCEDTPDGRVMFKDMQYHNVPRSTVQHIPRSACSYVEFHAALLQTSIWREQGGLDENLLSLHEYSDYGLTIAAAGHTCYYEPASVVRYLPPLAMTWDDLPFFALRWCESWNVASNDYFKSKWNVQSQVNTPQQCGAPTLDISLRWGRLHRQSAAAVEIDAAAVRRASRPWQARLVIALFASVGIEWFDLLPCRGVALDEALRTTISTTMLAPAGRSEQPLQIVSLDTTSPELAAESFLTMVSDSGVYRHWLAMPVEQAQTMPGLSPVLLDWSFVAGHAGRMSQGLALLPR